MAGPYSEEEQQRPPPAPSEQRQQEKEEGSDDHEGGILLYYAYRPLAGDGQREAMARWYEEEAAVGLVGRVRVALDGINATLGGSLRQLRRHIATVEAHPLLRPSAEPSSLLPQARDPIDFKLCINKEGARNAQCRAEAGFDRLRVSRCLEVVSLGPHAAAVLSRQGQQEEEGGEQEPARHVSPEEFHRLLEEAAAATTDNQRGSDGSSNQGRGVVLLDARNLYESRIGRFAVPGVPVLAPPVRQFSELPAWLDRNAEAGLKGKRIAMYCTGGVRCERLSQYIKAKGEGYQDVVQLKGGIQRYLEAFPGSGGFFRGKNFVFDERVAVGPPEAPASNNTQATTTTTIVGACLGCAKPWDDYGARARCRQCRMLVLACDACLLGSRWGGGLELVCERCAAGCDGAAGGGEAASRRSRWKKKGRRERRELEPQVGKDRRRTSRGVGASEEEEEEEEEGGGVEALAGLFAEAAGRGQ